MPATSPDLQIPHPRSLAASAIMGMLSIMLFWRQLSEWVNLSLGDARYSHLILIPVLSAFFLIVERRAIFAVAGFSPRSGGLLVFGSLLVYGLLALQTLDAYRLPLLMFAICLVWASGFALCYGLPALKAARFPWLLLLLLVPVPSPWMDRVIAVLQHGAAGAANAFFSLLGTPMFRDGTRFELQGVTIDIAPECSSIHSGWALFITGISVGHLFLKSLPLTFCLSALTVPIAMFTNGIRIVTLSLLSIHLDPDYLHGNLHQSGGVFFGLISLSILLSFLYMLKKVEHRSHRSHPVAVTEANGRSAISRQ